MAARKQTQLNPRQLLFLKFYLQTANATQSVIKAGYQPKYANRAAKQLLSIPAVKAEIDLHRRKASEKAIASFEDKANYLWSLVQDPNIASKNKMKAIEILNNMCGHNAATRHVNVNVDIGNDLESARGKYLTLEPARKGIDHKPQISTEFNQVVQESVTVDQEVSEPGSISTTPHPDSHE